MISAFSCLLIPKPHASALMEYSSPVFQPSHMPRETPPNGIKLQGNQTVIAELSIDEPIIHQITKPIIVAGKNVRPPNIKALRVRMSRALRQMVINFQLASCCNRLSADKELRTSSASNQPLRAMSTP